SRAIQDLGEFGPMAEEAIPTLVRCLGKERLGFPAAVTLGKVGPAAIPAVLKEIGSGDERSVEYGLMALGEMGPAAEELVPTIKGFLGHRAERIASRARLALYQIENPDKK